jgi:hypothetical protein
VTWPPLRALEARCFVHGSRPAAHHVCGVHAFSTRERALVYLVRNPPRPSTPLAGAETPLGVVFGRVSGWGRAVVHAAGWRSEFAYPFAVYVLGRDRGLARALADRYAVDADLLTL